MLTQVVKDPKDPTDGQPHVVIDYETQPQPYADFLYQWEHATKTYDLKLYWIDLYDTSLEKHWDETDPPASTAYPIVRNAPGCAKGTDIMKGGEVGVILDTKGSTGGGGVGHGWFEEGTGFLPDVAAVDLALLVAIPVAYFLGRSMGRRGSMNRRP